MHKLLAILLIMGISAMATAQNSPPPQEPPTKQEEAPKQEEPPPQEEAGKPPPPPKRLTLEVGWEDWGLDGNGNRFRQYATPPRGLFLRALRYASPILPRGHQGLFSLRAIGEDDYRAEGDAGLFYGTTRLEGYLSNNRFFDATPALVSPNDRTLQEGAIKQFLTRDFSLSVRYRMDEQDQFFEPPRSPQRQRTRYYDAIAAGRLGNGQLHLSLSNWRFFDRSGDLRDTKVDQWQIRYLWEPLQNVGLEGSFARLTVHQPSAPKGRVEILSLTGDLAAGPATDLMLTLRLDKLRFPVVQNASAREQRLAAARVTHRWNRWSAQLGLSEREVERIRGDRAFVDVPRWWTFEGRVTGRLNRQLRLTARGYTQNLRDGPPMITADPRALYFDGRRFAQVKIDGGWPDINGYASWTFHRWENDVRAVALTNNTYTVGGHWQATPVASLFAEWTYEDWRARSEIAEFPFLENFAPSSRLITLGVNWVIDSRTYVALNYTEFTSSNDNPLLLRDGNARGQLFTLNARHQFPSGHEVGLVVAPWTYRDRVVGAMNYDATVVMVTGSARF